jgi:hypothetical protein
MSQPSALSVHEKSSSGQRSLICNPLRNLCWRKPAPRTPQIVHGRRHGQVAIVN